ncbi:hypothetical protein ACF0H5_008186 [Mactra antiquata]
MHENFSILASHTLLNTLDDKIAENNDKVSTSSVEVPTERCKTHPTKVMDMYCRDHDEVACTVCFTSHYKRCEDIHYIPDIVATEYSEDEVVKSTEDVQKVIARMEKLSESCNNSKEELGTMKAACLDNLNDFHKEVIEIIDELRNKAEKEIGDKYNKLVEKLTTQVESIAEVTAKLQSMFKQLALNDPNKSTSFVRLKMCQIMMESAEGLYKHVSRSAHKNKLHFRGDHSVKGYLTKLTAIGSTRDQKATFSSPREPTAHDIRTKDDTDQCNIWGTLVTADGRVIVADNANNKLKLLAKNTYSVSTYCELPASPRSLCKVSDNEAAVSLSNKTVQYFSHSDEELTLGTTVNMDHNCFGLAVTNDQMYISDGSQSVYVYDMVGELQKTVVHASNEKPIFSESRDITVSDDGKKIHVADSRKGLVTLSMEGKVLWKYTGSELTGAYGVCTDGDGTLLVTGILSHNVMQMGQNGDKVCEIIKQSDGLYSPISVCFDRKNFRVLVTKNGNYLYSYEFS